VKITKEIKNLANKTIKSHLISFFMQITDESKILKEMNKVVIDVLKKQIEKAKDEKEVEAILDEEMYENVDYIFLKILDEYLPMDNKTSDEIEEEPEYNTKLSALTRDS